VLGDGLRSLLAGLAGVLCQGEDDARRWRTLGSPAERTVVVGNLKNDALPRRAPSEREARIALGLDPRDRCSCSAVCARARRGSWCARGSLCPSRARLMAGGGSAASRARFRRARGGSARRRAAGRAPQPRGRQRRVGAAEGAGAWRWDDRSGVLNAYYAVADVAFVGGSLLPYGGHNPLEPAAAGAAVVIGPHHPAQADAVRALAQGARRADRGARRDLARRSPRCSATRGAHAPGRGRGRVADDMRGARGARCAARCMEAVAPA
jgi:3-deoxy-D-manno-octulosonic-acid transferase